MSELLALHRSFSRELFDQTHELFHLFSGFPVSAMAFDMIQAARSKSSAPPPPDFPGVWMADGSVLRPNQPVPSPSAVSSATLQLGPMQCELRSDNPQTFRTMLQDAVFAAAYGASLGHATAALMSTTAFGGCFAHSEPPHALPPHQVPPFSLEQRPDYVPADAVPLNPKDGNTIWMWFRPTDRSRTVISHLGTAEAESHQQPEHFLPFQFAGLYLTIWEDLRKTPWWQVYDVFLAFRKFMVEDPRRIKSAVEMGSACFTDDGKVQPCLEYLTPARGFTHPSLQAACLPFSTNWLFSAFKEQHPDLDANSAEIQAVVIQLAKVLVWSEDIISRFQGVEVIAVNSQPKALLVYLHPVHPDINLPPPRSVVAWTHNTGVAAAAMILKEGIVRPSCWDPSDDSWLPTCGFYSRAHVAEDFSDYAFRAALICSTRKAWGYGDICQPRSVAVFGKAHLRQPHYTVKQGGVLAEHAANLMFDCVHGTGDKRWLIKSHLAQCLGLAAFVPRR